MQGHVVQIGSRRYIEKEQHKLLLETALAFASQSHKLDPTPATKARLDKARSELNLCPRLRWADQKMYVHSNKPGPTLVQNMRCFVPWHKPIALHTCCQILSSPGDLHSAFEPFLVDQAQAFFHYLLLPSLPPLFRDPIDKDISTQEKQMTMHNLKVRK